MQQSGQDRQELKQLQIEEEMHDRDVTNIKNKHFFLDQLIDKGYEIISHKIEDDGWFDGTHAIEAIVKKDGQLKNVKLSTRDRNPEWFVKHSCGGSSPLRFSENTYMEMKFKLGLTIEGKDADACKKTFAAVEKLIAKELRDVGQVTRFGHTI